MIGEQGVGGGVRFVKAVTGKFFHQVENVFRQLIADIIFGRTFDKELTPRALWWGVATLTTVGYGDVYPVTLLGKLAAGVYAFAGIGLVAMPTGIFASAMSDVARKPIKDE
ncbi:MAG: two pore domain potassium channel family protein [Porticoccaceae bacterium]|nr:two pore domain potassium channel family protein [Porticoccaceae bacterium]